MFDYYALPNDFPGFNGASGIPDVRERISFLECRFADDLNCRSFIPYIQLHEFEALLFADIDQLKTEYPLSSGRIQRLKDEADRYGDPEMINDGPATAPSKRIISAVSQDYHYNNKVQSGAAVALRIGIETMLANCRHFREWVESIRQLASNCSD